MRECEHTNIPIVKIDTPITLPIQWTSGLLDQPKMNKPTGQNMDETRAGMRRLSGAPRPWARISGSMM